MNEEIKNNTFISYFQLCLKEMAEHILTFSHLENEDYPRPKDKLPWKVNREEENKYKCVNRRFILTTNQPFEHPGSFLPED